MSQRRFDIVCQAERQPAPAWTSRPRPGCGAGGSRSGTRSLTASRGPDSPTRGWTHTPHPPLMIMISVAVVIYVDIGRTELHINNPLLQFPAPPHPPPGSVLRSAPSSPPFRYTLPRSFTHRKSVLTKSMVEIAEKSTFKLCPECFKL